MYDIIVLAKQKSVEKQLERSLKMAEKNEVHVKIIFVGVLLTLTLLLIPLFVIGHYNFPSIDDIGYGKTAEIVWDETHSVVMTCLRQISYAWDYWHTWQGTFAAEWFTTTVMGIFSRSAYYMGTYLSLGGFVLFELLLFMTILKKVLDADFFRAGIISGCIVSIQILLTPVPVEAFYWFCGSALYTVTYNETAILMTMLILLYHSHNSSGRWKRIPLYIGIILFTVLVSGGTYVTLILMLLLYLFTVIWYWYRKNPYRWFVTAGMVLYLLGCTGSGKSEETVFCGIGNNLRNQNNSPFFERGTCLYDRKSNYTLYDPCTTLSAFIFQYCEKKEL